MSLNAGRNWKYWIVALRRGWPGRIWPIYLIGASSPNVATLVIAGVHGNEVSGSLAAHDVLRMMRAAQPGDAPLMLLAPANPVGLARARATTRRDATSIATSLHSVLSRPDDP